MEIWTAKRQKEESGERHRKMEINMERQNVYGVICEEKEKGMERVMREG